MAQKLGLDREEENSHYPRSDIIPFEVENRFMATLHHDQTGQGYIFVKGAPERVLELCNQQQIDPMTAQTIDLLYWQEKLEQLAQQGLRVIAIANTTSTEDHRALTLADFDSKLSLLSVVGMMDPPRDEATEAVKLCQQASIRIKMITGDHASTALAIGKN